MYIFTDIKIAHYPFMQPMTPLILAVFLFFATCQSLVSQDDPSDYRERMVTFVESISNYAKRQNPDFLVVPQNGIMLLGDPQSNGNGLNPNKKYLNAIDGIGRESVFYGYNEDNQATPDEARNYINHFLKLAQVHHKTVLITDYCWSKQKIDNSYALGDSYGYISFAASHRELDNIPKYPKEPHRLNRRNIDELPDANNFLYLINTRNYLQKSGFIEDLSSTNYDILIVDLFFHGDIALTPQDIRKLKTKSNGSERLVIAYMSIGEAEDYRYYWEESWIHSPPTWMEEENPRWEGNYVVRYWDPQWQKLMFGSENAYLDRILSAGFDGVYLDLVDAYHYFEAKD